MFGTIDHRTLIEKHQIYRYRIYSKYSIIIKDAYDGATMNIQGEDFKRLREREEYVKDITQTFYATLRKYI